jgi:anti-sigma regulatory factor (Ser/Thr protein kinase)
VRLGLAEAVDREPWRLLVFPPNGFGGRRCPIPAPAWDGFQLLAPSSLPKAHKCTIQGDGRRAKSPLWGMSAVWRWEPPVPEGARREQRHSRLSGEAASALEARRFVRSTLAEWGMESVEQVASLLTSELVANVVLHSKGTCRLDISFDRQCLRVGVWDCNPRPPVRQYRSPLAATGKGLALVEALSSNWGWDHAVNGGKVVWFELLVPHL